MSLKNYYEILGLKKEATQEEIKTAFRKLSIKFHPDKNTGDEFLGEMFKNINEANETLSNVEKRKIYDFSFFNVSNDSYKNNNSNNSFQKSNDSKNNSNIKELTAIFFEKESVAKNKQKNFQNAENISKPNYLTIPKVLWLILILLGSNWLFKPNFELKNDTENNQWITTEKSKVYNKPDKNSEIIGEVENYSIINELEQTKYFIKIEITKENGNKVEGFIRKGGFKL